jgi:TPP-dependent 2-oxoacid decarboxylase
MKIKPSAQRPLAKLRRKTDRPERITVGQYLLRRLEGLGIRHIFGTGEPELLRFIKLIEYHPSIQFVKNSTPTSSGCMADGYARVRSCGCLATSLNFPGQTLETLLRAAHECVPLVNIIGTSYEALTYCQPLSSSKVHNILEDTMSLCEKVHRQLVKCWIVLDDPKTAAKKIDYAIDTCLYFQAPICIELPDEIVEEYIPKHTPRPTIFSGSDPEILQEALQHIKKILHSQEKPFIAMGRELICHECTSPIVAFAESYNIPLLTTYLGKKNISEDHPLWLGMYIPRHSSERVQDYLLQTDCGIFLGITESARTGFGFIEKDLPLHSIIATSSQLVIDNIFYPHITLKDLALHLPMLKLSKKFPIFSQLTEPQRSGDQQDAIFTIENAFESVQKYINESRIVVLECDDKMELVQKLSLHSGSFVSSTSSKNGWGLECAIAAQLASPTKRVIALLSPTSFQSSLIELSLCKEFNIDPLIIVFSPSAQNQKVNLGDSLISSTSCSYVELTRLFHNGAAIRVTTKESFEEALKAGLSHRGTFFLIEAIVLPRHS